MESIRSRRAFAALIAAACALLVACAFAQPAEASSASLRAKLEAATSGSVYYYSYADYDGDGSKEAFAVCGDSSGGGTITGKIYFVSSKGVVSAVTDTEYWWNYTASSKSRATSFRVKGTKTGRVALFHVPHYAAVQAYEWVCGVKSGKPYRSGAGGNGFKKIGASKFVASLSELDNMTYTDTGASAGRTFKPYYFKVTKNGVKEYGAISITKAQLKKCKNGTSVLRKLQSKGTVRKIWYRGNGIINVNITNTSKEYSYLRENSNYTLLLKGNGKLYYYSPQKFKVVKSLDDAANSGYGGIYNKAMHPKIASYPKHFKVAGKVVK